MNKFEEMLERLINEDKAGAEELFHDIVVEKSRAIYENLLSDDVDVEEDEKFEEELIDIVAGELLDDDEEIASGHTPPADDAMEYILDTLNPDRYQHYIVYMRNLDFEKQVDLAEEIMQKVEEIRSDETFENEDMLDDGMLGDETDELEADISLDLDSNESEEDSELEDRVVDVEDALDELNAEFEKIMAEMGDEDEDEDEDEETEDEDEDLEDDSEVDDAEEDEEEDDTEDEDEDEDDEEGPKDQVATMREYVEKVTAKMGDHGDYTKSTVAGKNDMGGTAENIARTDANGKSSGKPTAKKMDTKNVNVPGARAAKLHSKEAAKTDKTADNTQSTLKPRK